MDLIKKNIGNIFIHMRTISIKANYNYEEFKENFYNFWKEKDDLITNYKKFHYNEIDFNKINPCHMAGIFFLCGNI